ncbi:MAG: KilA-N domain-containing protein [Desulfobulbaceae bacterium]|nr:KilA-N domain-containing protein [Desulfobulbaceae bacterium]
MKKCYEFAEIGDTRISFDVTNISEGLLWFNATEVAKPFNKKPKDWLSKNENQEYISTLSKEDDRPLKDLVKVARGRYGGTWLHKSLRLPFARWCSSLFAIRMDKWVENRLAQEQERQKYRLETKTGYLALSEAIANSHETVKAYHFANEANLINRIVLGQTSKEYKQKFGVQSIREHLTPKQLTELIDLQQINTSLLKLGLTFQERKRVLRAHSDNQGVPQLLQAMG